MKSLTLIKKILLVLLLSLIVLSLTYYVFRILNSNISNTTTQSNVVIEQPLTYVIFGDSGSGDDNQKKVAKSIGEYCKEVSCQAIFHTGDIVYDKGITSDTDPLFVDRFTSLYDSYNIPVYLSLGNHDYDGCETCYIGAVVKQSKYAKFPSTYYEVKEKNSSFFVIDTEKFDKTQSDWLNTSLKASTSVWKFVLGHRPLVSTESLHGKETFPGKEDLRTDICKDTDILFSGHSHSLEFNEIPLCNALQVVSGGGGKELRAQDSTLKDNGIFFGNTFGFVSLEVYSEKVIINYFNSSRELIYQNSIEKE
jgi:predicted phosphodiesterase